ncbi:MAG: hypothetical protein GC191_01610 [Azospirillum sp.]|nr:hypothetical protein [Azospirillum sp.]
MKSIGIRGSLGMATLAIGLGAGPAWAEAPKANPTQPLPAETVVAAADDAGAGGMSDSMVQGLGCLFTGGGAMAWGMASGPSELIMIVAGGLLSPSSTSTLMISLWSTLAAASCGIGAVAAPTVVWAYEESDHIAAHLGRRVADAGAAVGKTVASLFAPPAAREQLADATGAQQ